MLRGDKRGNGRIGEEERGEVIRGKENKKRLAEKGRREETREDGKEKRGEDEKRGSGSR